MKVLIPVLESLGICNAVSLDDDYSLESKIADRELIDIDSFLSAFGEELIQEDRNIIDEKGVSFLSELFVDVSVPSEVKERINSILDMGEHSVATLSFLESGFESTPISYQKLSAVEHVEEAIKQGTIWFLDKEINARDSLPEVIPVIEKKSAIASIPCLIVVFTADGSFAKINDSWQDRYRYLFEQCGLIDSAAEKLSYSFFVISKEELSKKLGLSKQAAQQYVERILVDCLCGYCIYNLLIKMRSYASKANMHLIELAKNARAATIENMYYNMAIEGDSNAYSTIKNIQDLMQEKEYTSNFAEINAYILAMKRLATLPKGKVEAISANTINDIIYQYDWTQFQFIHKTVNQALDDISYGDIFELEYSSDNIMRSSYIGVLVTQPCDCVLRKKGDRIQRSSQFFSLLLFDIKNISCSELRVQEGHDWTNKIRRIRNNGIFIRRKMCGDDWTISYIEAGPCVAMVHINPFILDLISLDSEGRAKLKSEKEIGIIIEREKTQNWKEYFPTLQSAITGFQKKQTALKEKMPDCVEEILDAIYCIPFSTEKQEFAIQRIGHLEENLTELISYYYVSHTYRIGKKSLIALHDTDNKQGDV